jgi:hypothetical protein
MIQLMMRPNAVKDFCIGDLVARVGGGGGRSVESRFNVDSGGTGIVKEAT